MGKCFCGLVKQCQVDEFETKYIFLIGLLEMIWSR